MASSAPPFSAGTESEPILRAGPFSFPFMHRGVMSRRKQMDEKIHHRQYRFSVITIEGAHQQYDHDLKRRKRKEKVEIRHVIRVHLLSIEDVLIQFLVKLIQPRS